MYITKIVFNALIHCGLNRHNNRNLSAIPVLRERIGIGFDSPPSSWRVVSVLVPVQPSKILGEQELS